MKFYTKSLQCLYIRFVLTGNLFILYSLCQTRNISFLYLVNTDPVRR